MKIKKIVCTLNSNTNFIKVMGVIAFILIILSFKNNLSAQNNKSEVKEFPTPQSNPKQLFYLQRTENTNTVIYELNDQKGNLDPENPIHVFWILYVKQEEREELSEMEKKFVYGIKIKPLDKGQYQFTLAAYPKINFQLARDSNQKYHVYVTPFKQQMILRRTYIKMKECMFKFEHDVEFIEFVGIEVITGKEITERITP